MDEQKRLIQNQKSSKWYYENREKKLEYQKQYQKEHNRNEYASMYREQNSEKINEYSRRAYNKNKEYYVERRRKMLREHPEINRARSLVGLHVKKGKLIRPDKCSECGKICQPCAHHVDYFRPLDIQWLCRKCHSLTHRQDTNDIL